MTTGLFCLWHSHLFGLSLPETSFQKDVTMHYTVSMPSPHTHYFQVEITLRGNAGADLVMAMPVWTPGSYMVREFSRNIPKVEAFSGTAPLAVHKITKNRWRVATGDASEIRVRYRVYAFEQSVRTSFLDATRGYINGASVFLYPEGLEGTPGTLTIDLPREWKTITTGLEAVRGRARTFRFPNYDVLIDSPLLMGEHAVRRFSVDGTRHEIAIFGSGNLDAARLETDTEKIVRAARDIFGELPYDRFAVLISLVEGGRGGLEHLNSFSVEADPWSFADEKKYKDFLTLIAHEYFHTWNVKRIRPVELGPFDYDEEVYTESLWIAEGLTSYYELLLPLRAGLITVKEFFEFLGKEMKALSGTPGVEVQALTESSFDAWIKYYRPNEESVNATVSYYTKGAMIGLTLDLAILKGSEGKRSLDDVFAELYQSPFQSEERGYTAEEFRAACERAAGGSLSRIWHLVDGAVPIPYDSFLSAVSCRVKESFAPETKPTSPYFGFQHRSDKGRVFLKTVLRGSPADKGGLSASDELIGANGNRLTEETMEGILKSLPQGRSAEFLIARGGKMRTVTLVPERPPFDSFKIVRTKSATAAQKKLFERWVGKKWDEAEPD